MTHSPLPNREYGFDFKVDRTVISKRLGLETFKSPPNPNSVDLGPVFNQLVILGPFSEQLPKVLLVYPAAPLILDPMEFEHLPSFCFPAGFEPTHVKKDLILDQFVFTMRTSRCESGVVYGVCTVASFCGRSDAFFCRGASKAYPVCFCYLTHDPVLAPIFQFTTLLIGWLAGMGIVMVSRNQTERGEEEVEILPGMVRDGNVQTRGRFVIPPVFLGQVSFMRELRVHPDEVRAVEVSRTDHLAIPPRSVANRSICFIALDLLCSRLSAIAIVRAMSILLLEKQVVFVASSVHSLSLCMMCLMNLCRPFKLRGTYLTVLPSGTDLVAILDSPFPYACGILKRAGMPGVPSHVVVIDLDSGSICDPDESPVLPQGEVLAASIEAVINRNRADVEVPATSAPSSPSRISRFSSMLRRSSESSPRPPMLESQQPSPEVLDFLKKRLHSLIVPAHYLSCPRRYIFKPRLVTEIVDMIRRHFAPKLDQLIQQCFITDTTEIEHPVTVFNRELFISSVRGPELPFYEAFLGTTAFDLFSEGMMNDAAEELSHSSLSSPSLSPSQH
jgi:hypothetical protein